MEAKDNKCMGCGQTIENPQQYHPYECCVSFKAGQKSIVDVENYNYKRGFRAALELIGDELKKWGL